MVDHSWGDQDRKEFATLKRTVDKSSQVPCVNCGHYVTKFEIMSGDAEYQHVVGLGWVCPHCMETKHEWGEL